MISVLVAGLLSILMVAYQELTVELVIFYVRIVLQADLGWAITLRCSVLLKVLLADVS